MNEISQKILFVDDDGSFLKAMKRQLHRKFDVATALDGAAGIRMLDTEGPFAVVVSDYKMPKMNGVQFLQEVYRLAPDTARVMLTEWAELDVAVSALHEARIYRFLSKLAPAEILEVTLKDCIEQYRLRATERKLTTELNQANEELRTLNWTLEQAYVEAEAASRAKSEFLAMVSHELRTPMNSILGFTESMINDPKDPPNEKCAKRLEKVHRNAKNLLGLIVDLLDVAQIEAHELALGSAPVDVGALARECVDLGCTLLQGKPVRLEANVSSITRIWEGDEARLRQIIMNLLSNAAKFTKRGRITLEMREQEQGLRITVQDTGIGIASDDLTYVFDHFRQADSSSTRRAGGLGLGLAICQKLCENMGGTIDAYSEVGHGSTFTVRLPWRAKVGKRAMAAAGDC